MMNEYESRNESLEDQFNKDISSVNKLELQITDHDYTSNHQLDPQISLSNIKTLQDKYQVDHKQMIKKLDLCVTFPMVFIFFVASINRSNFEVLYLQGIGSSIGISFYQYFTAVAVFFIPYVIFQSFSNLTLKYIRPHFWISSSVLMYGSVILGEVYIKKYSHLLVCQFLHGLIQAGTDTSMIYLLLSYFAKGEIQKRVSIIYSCSTFAVFFNNFVAYGLAKHHKVTENSYTNWQFILLIEGSITIASAFLIFFIMPDFPEGNRFLKDNETIYIIKRLEILYGKSGYHTQYTLKDIFNQLIDPMIWLPSITAIFMGGTCYAFIFLDPLVYSTFKGLEGLPASAYGWLTSALVLIIFGFVCDFFGNSFYIIFFSLIIALYGVIATTVADVTTTKLVYSGIYCVVIGCFCSYPIFFGLVLHNLHGHLRKSIGASLMVASFDIGGIYGIFCLKNNDPLYRRASHDGLSLICVSILLVAIYGILIYFRNKSKSKNDYITWFESLSRHQQIIHGDRKPSYKYQY